jgi:hypothetical protein
MEDRPMTKCFLAAIAAASITLTACTSPYDAALRSSLARCVAGMQAACDSAAGFASRDQEWNAAQTERAGNVAAGLIGEAAVMNATNAANAARYHHDHPSCSGWISGNYVQVNC